MVTARNEIRKIVIGLIYELSRKRVKHTHTKIYKKGKKGGGSGSGGRGLRGWRRGRKFMDPQQMRPRRTIYRFT